MWHDLFDATRPLIAEVVVLILSPFILAALLKLQRWAGVSLEARHREALH